MNQPPIRLIIPYISFIYSTSTTTLAIQITKRLRGCGVIRLQRYVENLLTNAKDRTKSLKQIKYLINLPNQTNQALRLNKQTNQRPDFCLICLFTRLVGVVVLDTADAVFEWTGIELAREAFGAPDRVSEGEELLARLVGQSPGPP
jgi:hypothetical protein